MAATKNNSAGATAEAARRKAERAALDRIPQMSDPAGLRTLRQNALRQGAGDVADAAFRRLVEVLPEGAPGTVEHDLWQTIHAVEEMLGEERGRTARMTRARQKIAKVGVRQVLEDFAASAKPADGFQLLVERGLPELTGEAAVLRHAGEFSDAVVTAARARLTGEGVDTETLSRAKEDENGRPA